jgi:hypothetical protein
LVLIFTFSAEVYRGATDKILFYFQGGGACWDQDSLDNSGYGVKNTRCRTDAIPWPVYGVFDISDPRNAYREYTIVNVLYCSGDNHAGNAVREFTDSSGNPAEQRGSVNVEAVLTWLQQQQRAGLFASTLENLVVMGCSAGSLASQLWGNEIVKRLGYPKRAAIVLDSYIGLFPDGIEGEMIYGLGMCELSFISEDMRALCREKKATTPMLTYDVIQSAPNVPYLFLHSRTDRVQIKYYNFLVESFDTTEKAPLIDEEGFIESADAILEKYNELPNFLVYYVDSSQHCYTPTPYVFFANTEGIGAYDDGDEDKDDVGGGGDVEDDDVFTVDIEDETMNKWLTRAPLQVGKKLYSQCSNGLCSEDLVPKEYWQQGSSSSSGSGSGGKDSEAYRVKSNYEPSIRVKQMHGVAHLDSEFNLVDSTFNLTHVHWNTYTSSLVTVPVLVYTIGVFALLVFLFFLCIRSRRFAYTAFDGLEGEDDEEQGAGADGLASKGKAAGRGRDPPKKLVTLFLGCMGAAFFLNMMIFVGNDQVYNGTTKGDNSLRHLQNSFLSLEDISDSLMQGAHNLTDVLVAAQDVDNCKGIAPAVYYLGDYETYAYEFSEAIGPVEPKVEFARETMDTYAVEKKNGLVFTVFTVVTVALLLFALSWHLRSVAMMKVSIGIAVFISFLGLIFATLYMIFLVR